MFHFLQALQAGIVASTAAKPNNRDTAAFEAVKLGLHGDGDDYHYDEDMPFEDMPFEGGDDVEVCRTYEKY